MRLIMLALLPALVLALALAGCNSPDDSDALDADSYSMLLSGMPSGPVAPGSMFNVTVEGRMGSGMGMHERMSDHIGAHFWNMTHGDPTGALGSAVTCIHSAGELPGTYRAQCTAPMEPGTYHLRAHARMAGQGSMMHHWWSDEQTFTVA